MTVRNDLRAPGRAFRAALHFAFAAATAFGLSAPMSAMAQDEGEDPLAATVEGREIHRSDVLESARDLPPAYLEQIETIYPFLRDRLVDFELVTIDGRNAGLADDEEVKALVREFEDEAIRRVYLTRLIEQQVTDEMLQERYDSFIAAQPPVEEVRARHILVETEAEARDIIAQLDNGGDFATLAQERSIDRASADSNGGDLGYFVHAEMVGPFADAAFALDPGTYSADPVQTEYGWHVVMVDDHRVRAAPPFEEMREELRSQLAEQVIRERLDELRADASVELFDYFGDPDERANVGEILEDGAEPDDAPAAEEPTEPEAPAEETDPEAQ